jgi:pilus assembly protein CpaC
VTRRFILGIVLLVWGATTTAIAQQPSAVMPPATLAAASPSPGSPSPGSPPSLPGSSAPSRAVAIAAGTGVLITLPHPAATIISAQPSIARVQPASPTSLFLTGVAPGRTTVIATNDAGDLIAQFDIEVTGSLAPPSGPQNLGALAGALPTEANEITPETAAALRSAILQTVPDVSGLTVKAVGRGVVLNGFVPSPAEAERIESVAHTFLPEKAQVTDNIVTSGRLQVNVRVRVAEISRSITRELGINWLSIGQAGNIFRLGFLTGTGLTSGAQTIANPVPLTNFAATTGLGGSANFGQFGFGTSGANGNLDVTIDALAADNLVSVLAKPNLTVLSGETASFLAGGEFPVPVAGNSQGNTTTISVDFKPYGVSLAVVPTILDDRRLNLRIRPEVSEISTATTDGAVNLPIAGGALTIPALLVRRAETTIELGSGQSFAIAGLLERKTTDQSQGLPGLGELPVIGALFKSTLFQRGDTELVIVVTPYIVKPASSPRAFRLPTDGFHPATDLDRILFGRQLAPGSGGQPLDAGFILK